MLADRIVAHRGYQHAYPENTLLAYREAIAAGAHCIETDISLSADHQAMLYHDPTLKRVSNKKGRVEQYTAEQLQTFPAYEPKRFGERFINETIAPLADLVALLQQHPHVTGYIEVKKEAVAFAGIVDTYAIISQCLKPVAPQCPLISFDYDFIAHARAQGWQRCGVVLTRWDDLDSSTVKEINPDTVFCNYKKIPAQANLDDCNFELVLYEIAEVELAKRWLRRGADKIETFDVAGLIQTLSRHSL
ncbi:MAG: glycerophosphodiester phosphodiesterase family protein [Porticoccaceae bacterium]